MEATFLDRFRFCLQDPQAVQVCCCLQRTAAASNNPFTINGSMDQWIDSQPAVPLDNGVVERTIVLSQVTGPAVFEDAPLPGSLSIQVGSLFMAASNYTLAGSIMTFAANQTLVGI